MFSNLVYLLSLRAAEVGFLHLHVNRNLQYVFLCCRSSSNSENSSRQLPQIRMSGLPGNNMQKKNNFCWYFPNLYIRSHRSLEGRCPLWPYWLPSSKICPLPDHRTLDHPYRLVTGVQFSEQGIDHQIYYFKKTHKIKKFCPVLSTCLNNSWLIIMIQKKMMCICTGWSMKDATHVTKIERKIDQNWRMWIAAEYVHWSMENMLRILWITKVNVGREWRWFYSKTWVSI